MPRRVRSLLISREGRNQLTASSFSDKQCVHRATSVSLFVFDLLERTCTVVCMAMATTTRMMIVPGGSAFTSGQSKTRQAFILLPRASTSSNFSLDVCWRSASSSSAPGYSDHHRGPLTHPIEAILFTSYR